MAKAPKKPKKTASLVAWENYEKKIAKFNQDKKRKEMLIRKHSN
jgi:hypothetical protein